MSSHPRKLDDTTIGRIREIKSTVDCECPNHVAEVVQTLQAFEAYSEKCLSQNTADAQMHAKLLAYTTEARVIMETALLELLVHEGIDLEKLKSGT